MLDVWNARLLANSKYDGKYEIPIIEKCDININEIKNIIPFSEILRTNNFNQWVCFYENDEAFERIWKRPIIYLEKLKKFSGIITPDFSVYQDMPFAQQIYNIYRQRVIGKWLQSKDINIIVNVRWGDYRTFKISTLGVPKHSIIAIGTVGCFKNQKYSIDSFYLGLKYIISKINPSSIIFYGPVTNRLCNICNETKTPFYIFPAFNWKYREVHNG